MASTADDGRDPRTTAHPTGSESGPHRRHPARDEPKLEEGEGRRLFLLSMSSTLVTFTGFGFFVWPFLHSMNPAADVEATATTEIDISSIAPGESVTVVWRGKPVFVRHRTPEEIEAARSADGAPMPEPESDAARVKKAEWLVTIGICDHLGCVPRGQRPTDPKGDYGGWFCPCHGSHFDTSGRVRKGPAPNNMRVPEYEFVGTSRLRIG
jgi:ubiquinol-cytochrome c reductase iron-sulfur subunit